jgi:glycosyltransferase involved in cell wall biosynthesis
VHFGYRDLEKGRPRWFPSDLHNASALDQRDVSRAARGRIARYVREHDIDLVWLLDAQPVNPLFRELRSAGARALVSYWGAPISSPSPRWKLLLKRLELAISRSKLDALVFESRAMAELALVGRGAPARMVHVVPLGIDVARFQLPRSDYAQRTLGIAEGKKIVLYAGHVDRRKGVHVLVEAAIELLHRRKRPDVCFVLCGNQGSQSAPFEQMYAGLGIDQDIRFGGYRGDLPQLYASSTCGVIASAEWDSFPRTSIEMAAAGLPVVASRLGGLPEAVLDRETGLLFPPGDASALADRLEELLDDAELRAALGKRGRERCEREFTLEVQRERLITLAETVLAVR